MPTIGAAEKQAKKKQTAAAKQAKAAAMRKKAVKKPAGPTIAQLKARIRTHNKVCPVLKLSGTKATLSHRLAAVGQRQPAQAAQLVYAGSELHVSWMLPANTRGSLIMFLRYFFVWQPRMI